MHLEDVLFLSNAVKLAGTLAWSNASPSHEQRAVILAAGSGHHDRDETVCGKTPFKTISDSLAARGFTVLRFDSRGVGASGGSTEDTTFDTKVEDLLAAHTYLTTRGIAPGRVAFVGHSEGGLTAGAAAAKVPSAPDYCTLLQQRPERILSEVRAPILAMFGGKDVQVEAEPNLHAFRAATAGNPNATAHVFADHNHLFQVADTGAIEEYEHLGDAPSPAALDYLAVWLTAAMERGDRRSA